MERDRTQSFSRFSSCRSCCLLLCCNRRFLLFPTPREFGALFSLAPLFVTSLELGLFIPLCRFHKDRVHPMASSRQLRSSIVLA